MTVLSITKLTHRVGEDVIFDKAELQLSANERVCVVGRNGAGKSTLLRILSGDLAADDIDTQQQAGLTIARLPQDVPPATDETVYDVVAAGSGEVGKLLVEFNHVAHEGVDLDRMGELQAQIDQVNGWTLDARVQAIITRMNLPADKRFGDLSGGWRRRVWLGRVLLQEPSVLLLDEPTNHLDIEGIQWLESLCLDFRGCLVFISHDRAFTRALAQRVVDIDRGRITSWEGTFDNYLIRKEEFLESEAKQQALFDKRLAEEEVWIRQGIKARRTRNEGRVRALKELRKQRSARRNVVGNARMNLDASDVSGKKVFEIKGLSKSYGDQVIVDNFSSLVIRGDRIGLIGPNGVGKSTLLKLMLEKETPDSGEVQVGTNLEVAYFDQQRNALDLEARPVDWVGDGREMISIGGKERHVISYLQDFLFTPDRARSRIGKLSGGERNRLLLARLFLRPANLLVLDEPTNDLDVETLELLEEQLMNYTGTVLLVSHDRAFLDNVVTSSWVFDGHGGLMEYAGGYTDARRQMDASKPQQTQTAPKEKSSSPKAKKPVAKAPPARKLTFDERKELGGLPAKLEKLEASIEELQQQLADPAFYQKPSDKLSNTQAKLAKQEAELESCFERWETLEALS